MDNNIYTNPLITRYASKEMASIFSQQNRIKHFRKLWAALAESQYETGLNITKEQVEELKNNILPINFDKAAEKEKEVRHDVMAHVYAYGLQCPMAAPIIHLGATSCFVTDNADIIVYKQALELVRAKLAGVMNKLADFAYKYRNLPTLGYTHLQPAQLVTVGKRAALWLQDFLMDFYSIDNLIKNLKLRGLKGATGTQASFMELYDNDEKKVKELEKRVIAKMGFDCAFTVTGQTYTRKLDYNITSTLSMIAQSAYKFSNDIRLLQSMKEMEEPFETSQIGSSAMAYKRNPMRCERISSLSRFLITLPMNTSITASTQWLERTLDDSANRRIVMGQAFLAADAILELMLNVTDGLVVYENTIKKRIMNELPFMATETILMLCVKAGGNRQELHEAIRIHSMEAAKNVKLKGKRNDLIDRIKKDPLFAAVHDKLDKILSPKRYIGRAPQQVLELLKEVKPILKRFANAVDLKGSVNV
ncbi:MAG: adenylosuccinate lyase [Christensenellales bacterium]|jgi:adenylosuccinate lyase|nr:adenylosuccinate lyase [Clostridiales bacterium]